MSYNIFNFIFQKILKANFKIILKNYFEDKNRIKVYAVCEVCDVMNPGIDRSQKKALNLHITTKFIVIIISNNMQKIRIKILNYFQNNPK